MPAGVHEVRDRVEGPKGRVVRKNQRVAIAVRKGLGHAGRSTVERHVDRESGIVDTKPQEAADRCRKMAPQLCDKIPTSLLRAHSPLIDVRTVAVLPSDGPRAIGRARGLRADVMAWVQDSAFVMVPHVHHDVRGRNLGLRLDMQGHAGCRCQVPAQHVVFIGLLEVRILGDRCEEGPHPGVALARPREGDRVVHVGEAKLLVHARGAPKANLLRKADDVG
mmetsp:Transcript_88380/g.225014  ORF Transcript_88380/g.225014 Transcript_88380/m.225014 type:complete len:221 (-) Transcript_88380:364-1026(-)